MKLISRRAFIIGAAVLTTAAAVPLKKRQGPLVTERGEQLVLESGGRMMTEGS